jgi:hypothetical protein
LAYFVPDITFATSTAVPLRALDVGAASASGGEFVCVQQCEVQKLQFTVTTEAISGTTTAPTVTFTKRPTPGSATGAAVVGVLTLPSGTAIGKTVYKLVSPVVFQVGDAMQLDWTIGVGTPTGEGIPSWICHADPEVEPNNADEIASA